MVQRRIRQLLIPANSQLKFDLVYTPQQVGEVAFTLPLQLGAPAAQLMDLNGIVLASCLKPRLTLNPAVIAFNTRMALSKERARKHPYVQTVILSNKEDKPLQFRLQLRSASDDGLVARNDGYF